MSNLLCVHKISIYVQAGTIKNLGKFCLKHSRFSWLASPWRLDSGMPSQPPRPREARPSVFGLKSHFLSMGVPHPAFEEKPTKGSVCGVQQVWAALCWDTMPGLTGAEHSDQKASSTAQWLASVQATGTIFRHASPNQSTACISGWQEENIGGCLVSRDIRVARVLLQQLLSFPNVISMCGSLLPKYRLKNQHF